MLNRIVTKEYKIPGTDVVLEKGTPVIIPALGLQLDERFYPNPKKFIPERFNEENSAGKTFVDRPYMPFGEGPRNCIGTRMGKMQTKIGLISMLQKYNFALGDQHIGKDIVLSPSAFVPTPINGLELKISIRQ